MPMLDNEEGPKDWEIKDEEPPESLKRKWDQEEASNPETVICSACRKETPAENLTCVFCGGAIPQGSCLVSGFLTWIKRLFKKGGS